ncbi:hypothetical protein [Paraburkholderia sp. GAS32]|uniref:hypothetical protein n=1 Tax=Paraburkholderia sp. GAS32 TaxID=3035129 RepID=UPI003D21A9F8
MKFAAKEIHAVAIEFPSGKFGFAGFKIPGVLRFDATEENIEKAHECLGTQFLPTRAFPTMEDAEAALSSWLAANPGYTNTGIVAAV